MFNQVDQLMLQAFQKYWERSSDMVFIKDVDGVYLDASEAFLKTTVFSTADDIRGKTDYDIFADPELARRYVNDDARLLAGDVSLENYIEPFPSEGELPRYCLTSKYILRNSDGAPTGILGVSRDITREYMAKQNYENELKNLFELPEDALVAVLFDITAWRVIDSRSRDVGDRILSRFVTMDQYIENASNAVVEDEAFRAYLKGLTKRTLEAEYQNGTRSRCFSYLRRMPDKTERWVEERFHYLLDPVNNNLTLIVLIRDIDASKRQYSELVRAAEHDAVTDLFNRSAMIRRIQQYLEIEGADKTHALFMIDLDNFKQINDSFGHQYGDDVLNTVSSVIKSTFRSVDIIGRMGGDEFMVLMKNVPSEKVACKKAQELLSALQFASYAGQTELSVTSSVGITFFQAGTRDLDMLYHEADMALYQSKRSGKNCYCVANVGPSFQTDDAPASTLDHVDTVQLRTLLDYMDGGVVLAEVLDDIRITYVSPSLYRTFGLDSQKSTNPGQGIFSFVLPEDLPKLKATVMQAAQGDECLDHVYRVNSCDNVEWRRIRTKRIPERGDGIHRVVSVITDISDIKRTNDRLREMETRYRTAIEQTRAMLWEVDIPSQTLTLTGAGWTEMGIEKRVYPNAPENHPRLQKNDLETSVEFQRMFRDIYAGKESASYYFKSIDSLDKEVWLNANYKLLYTELGVPYCALGVTVPVPNINVEMRRFEQELRFHTIVQDSLLGYVRANLTQNLLEVAVVPTDPRYDALSGSNFDEYYCNICATSIDADSLEQFCKQTARDALLDVFDEGESWRFSDYRRIHADGVRRWASLFIKLMRHPISGDVYAFGYLRDNEIRHEWETALNTKFQRNSTLSLYTQDTMRTISSHILANCRQDAVAAVSVVELCGLDRVRVTIGTQEANEILFTFGRICRIAISSDVVIGQLNESQISLLRADAGSAAMQQERVTDTIAILKELLLQAYPDADIKLIGGFAVKKAHLADYDQLLYQASIACKSATQALGVSAVAYADIGTEASEVTDANDLAACYHALELRYQQQANLLHISENDELTGILGKPAFYRRARELLDSSPEVTRILVRFDVNRFKVYNDVRGVAAGDALLRSIASLIRKSVQPGMLYARLVSDHFVLLVPDDPEAVKRSVNQLEKWLVEHSPDFRLSCTVGAYRITDPSIDVSLMCDRALLALHTGKSGFDTKLIFYDEALRNSLLEEQQLMDDTYAALKTNQFELYFQPQVNYDDGSLIGAEALVRWNHPQRGLLSPGVFIPLLEKNGSVTLLDEYVWEKSCQHIRRWIDTYPLDEIFPVSVNVSRVDIYDPNLCAKLTRIIQKYDLPTSALHLEITESAYMENPHQLIDTVHALQATGFRVEMDDFGSGYSSLNTLKDIAVDVLKLDMNFLANCDDRARGGQHPKFHHSHGALAENPRHCRGCGNQGPSRLSQKPWLRIHAGLPFCAPHARARF